MTREHDLSDPIAPLHHQRRMRRWLMGIGVVCILAGLAVVGYPFFHAWQLHNSTQSAVDGWNKGGADALKGALPTGKGTPTSLPKCGSGASTDYALVSFPSLATYNYADVAVDGTWDLLKERTMVHYHGTPDPGQQGNSIIAFHREPQYEHIDDLKDGDTITVQDRACHVYTYTIQQHWDLSPDNVTQLVPTDGHDLTLITCTPWWQDYDRLVWRASLTSST